MLFHCVMCFFSSRRRHTILFCDDGPSLCFAFLHIGDFRLATNPTTVLRSTSTSEVEVHKLEAILDIGLVVGRRRRMPKISLPFLLTTASQTAGTIIFSLLSTSRFFFFFFFGFFGLAITRTVDLKRYPDTVQLMFRVTDIPVESFFGMTHNVADDKVPRPRRRQNNHNNNTTFQLLLVLYSTILAGTLLDNFYESALSVDDNDNDEDDDESWSIVISFVGVVDDCWVWNGCVPATAVHHLARRREVIVVVVVVLVYEYHRHC